MQRIATKQFVQDFLVPLTLAPVLGASIGLLTFQPGYATVLLVVGGPPVVLWLFSAVWTLRLKLTVLCVQTEWWQVLWLLLGLSGLVFRIRTTGTIEESPLDLWALYRIIVVSIIAIVLLSRLATGRTNWLGSLFEGLMGLLSWYSCMSLFSTLWSANPLWTLYKSSEYCVDVALMAAIILSIKTPHQMKAFFDWSWVFIGVLIATVWGGVIVWPEWAVNHQEGILGYRIEGVLPAISKNSVGEYGALLAIVASARLLGSSSSRRFYWGVLCVGIVTLIFSQSRSPLVGFLVALVLMLFVTKRIGVMTLAGAFLTFVLSLTTLSEVFWEFFLRGQSSDLFLSLTGRMDWWKFGWDIFMEQPLIGHGAHAASRFIIFKGLEVESASIHSVWLEVLFGVGLLGILPLVGCFWGMWKVSFRTVPYPMNMELADRLHVEYVGALTLLSVRSIFSSGAVMHPSTLLLLALGYAEWVRRRQRRPMAGAIRR